MGRLAVDTVCARCLLCCGAWLAIGACASVIARVTRMYVSSRDGMYVCLLCVNGRVTYVCVVCVSPTAKGSRKVGVSCVVSPVRRLLVRIRPVCPPTEEALYA